MAIDIGGTLAKTAFYVPPQHPEFADYKNFEMLTQDTIPSKLV